MDNTNCVEMPSLQFADELLNSTIRKSFAHSSFFFSGGLFHPADDKQEIAFRYAVEKINADRAILPRSKLSAQIEKMSPQDSFHASKKGKSFNQETI